MNRILDLLNLGVPGSFGIRRGKGFSLGDIPYANLPTCDVTRDGEQRRSAGAAGVADRFVRCSKNAANAYAWEEVQPLNTNLTTLGGLTATTDNMIVGVASAWASRTPAQVRTTLGVMGTLLATVPVSAGATVSLPTSTFTSTYANYLVEWRLSESATNTTLLARLRVAGVDDINANYYSSLWGHNSGGASGIAASSAATSWQVINAGGVGVTWTDCSGFMLVSSPQLTDETLAGGTSDGKLSTPILTGGPWHGLYNATTSFDAMTLFPGTGNITGTMWCYGILGV